MLVTLKIFLYILTVHRVSKAEPLSGWIGPAKAKEFPFVVSIARRFDIPANNPYGHTCGGALITKRHILTSANCFLANKTPSDYFVYAGSNDLDRSTKFEIQSYISYRCWSSIRQLCRDCRYSDNDIAVAKLATPVRFPVQPPKLSRIAPRQLVGKNVKTAGWGLTFDDTAPRLMLKADLRVISNGECTRKIWTASNGTTFDVYEHNVFCTNGVALFAVLDDGDRGSPVFIDGGNGNYRIVGVNQKSVPSVNSVDQIPDQQNKHIGVHHYLKFIKSVTKGTYLH